MEDESGIRVCAVCGRVLDHWEGRGWAHPLNDLPTEDHVAVPVLQGQVPTRGRCDFCHAEAPQWLLPARTFEVAPGHGSDGDWSACDRCAALLRTNQWTALLRRVAAQYEQRRGRAMSEPEHAGVGRLYRVLRKNVTGALRPLPAEQDGGTAQV